MDLTRIGPSHGVFVGSCAWITQKKRQSGAHNIFSTSCIHNNCMGCTLVLFGAHSPLNGGPIIYSMVHFCPIIMSFVLELELQIGLRNNLSGILILTKTNRYHL